MEEEQPLNLEKGLRLIAKSSLVVLIGVILSKVFTYIYRIIIARYYGPEIYGLFSLALMISGWFVVFSSLGLSEGVLRYISLYRGQAELKKIKHLFKISSIILFFTSIISGVILFFLAELLSINIFHNSDLTIFLQIFSIVIPLTVFMQLYLSTLRAFEKIAIHSFIFNILQNLIKVLALVILIFLGLNTNSVIFSYIFGIFAAFFVSYLVCRFSISTIFEKYVLSKKSKSNILKNVFSYSWPLLFFGVIYSVFYWTDSFVIGFFKTAADVGLYNVAIPIALLLSLAPELFMQLFFPMVTKEYSRKNIRLIRQLSKQVGKWILTINLPILILILIFPGVFINILFGSQYLAAENALRFLAVGFLFMSVLVVSRKLLSMAGKSKIILTNIIITSIINIILNLILVPRYGINGAAISTATSLIILNLLFLFQANHYVSIIPLRRKMFRVLLISLIPAALMVYAKLYLPTISICTLIFLGVSYIVIYLALIFLTRCLDKNDIMIITTIRKKILGK